jgi:hypothetical protein
VKTEFGLFLKFQKSYSFIHALLTCFVFVFVISDVFASFLGALIEFPWPGMHNTIVRVSEVDLGFHKIGKIGP